jgi:hypothetical protein
MNSAPNKGTRPLPPPGEDNAAHNSSAQQADNAPINAPEDDVHMQQDASLDEILEQIRQRNYPGVEQLASRREQRMIPRLATDAQPWRVILQTMGSDPKVLGVDVRDIAVVGRSDQIAPGIPELDLEPFGAQEHGVSRRHAILLPDDDGLALIDLESTNGTWINGVYLQPGQKYQLRVGDRVEFGRLRLVVRVVGAMLQGGDAKEQTAITRPRPGRNK